MTLPNLRIVLAMALICAGSVAHAQQAEPAWSDSLFSVYANELAAKLPCNEARKKVKDSAHHLMYNVCKARWQERNGVLHGTATSNGKTHPSTMVVDPDSDVIPLDSASLAFVYKEWIRKENCR